jgi:hypothetical protein
MKNLCRLTSLSSRKSWVIFALSIEKTDFFIFAHTDYGWQNYNYKVTLFPNVMSRA